MLFLDTFDITFYALEITVSDIGDMFIVIQLKQYRPFWIVDTIYANIFFSLCNIIIIHNRSQTFIAAFLLDLKIHLL